MCCRASKMLMTRSPLASVGRGHLCGLIEKCLSAIYRRDEPAEKRGRNGSAPFLLPDRCAGSVSVSVRWITILKYFAEIQMPKRFAVDEERATLLLAHMAKRAAETVRLSGVAHELGMSPSTAQRALRSRGLDFRTALVRIRLQQAERLLHLEPDLKVEAVSRSVGWKSRKSLYAALRRISGQRMAEFRAGIDGQRMLEPSR